MESMKSKAIFVSLFVLACAMVAFAADTVLTWPSDGKDPIVKVTIGKLRQVNSTAGQVDYVADATVENVGKKPLPIASFYVYLFDKNKKRIGEGYFELTNLAAGQQTKVAVTAKAMGSIASMELQPQHLPSDEPVKVKVAVASKPSGASVKVDGQESGYTPQTLMLLPGKHTIEFAKEGYAPASAPVDVAASSIPQGVSLELSPAAQDTVVLRDGTVVMGDVSAVTMATVTVKVGTKVKSYPRNQVARVVFVERTVVKRPVVGKRT